MSFILGKNSRVYQNQYDITSYCKGVIFDASADTYNSTTFGNDANTYLPGLKESTLSIDALFEATPALTEEMEAAVAGTLGSTNNLVTIVLDTEAQSNRTFTFYGVDSKYTIESPVDDLISLSMETIGNTGFEPGIVIKTLGNKTVTGNEISIDNSAGTTAGYSASLHVISASGSNVIKVQHSTNNSAWSDLVTFTTVTGPTFEYKTLLGSTTVNRYIRCSYTIGTACNFFVSFSRK